MKLVSYQDFVTYRNQLQKILDMPYSVREPSENTARRMTADGIITLSVFEEIKA